MSVLELSCGAQNYDWGKVGKSSLVYELLTSENAISGKNYDASLPYAELWLGTHKNMPSIVKSGEHKGSELKVHLNQHTLSEKIFNEYGGDLPFLFKVLSVKKPLSIQSHPDKKTAEKLNADMPHIYKDPNHKPEMVISVTPFKALIGFKPFLLLKETILASSELKQIIGSEFIEKYFNNDSLETDNKKECEAIEHIVKRIVNCEEALVAEVLKSFRYKCSQKNGLPPALEYIKILIEHYPNDPGCIISLLLNYVELNPGEAAYLPANEPHCYVYGDAVECMSTSDNVIRIGCTSKYKDLSLFLNTVSYKPRTINEILLAPKKHKVTSSSSFLLIYAPPIPEFFVSVFKSKLNANSPITLDKFNGPCIVLVASSGTLSLCGSKSEMGSVFFVPAGLPIVISTSSHMLDITLYIASSNC